MQVRRSLSPQQKTGPPPGFDFGSTKRRAGANLADLTRNLSTLLTLWRSEVNSNCRYLFLNNQMTTSCGNPWRPDEVSSISNRRRHAAFRAFLRRFSEIGNSLAVSGQFERSGDLRWNRALRNSTMFSAPRESCLLARPAFVAAEAEIASAHAGERINFSRARVSATYMM